MTSLEVRNRFDAAGRAAAGRWRDIFVSAGIDAELLCKQNRPCPLCGGTDRFSFTDKFKRGDYLCRHCGHGDGFQLLSLYLSVSSIEALEFVERFCGIPVLEWRTPKQKANEPAAGADVAKPLLYHLRIWQEAHRVTPGDAVWRYLQQRGLDPTTAGEDIRTHDGLSYSDAEEGLEKSLWPAMLTRMTDRDGVVTAVHRTYLTADGRKAPVASVKKITAGPTNGAVARLGQPDAVMGIAEGVETALAASEWFEMAVWAAIGAENLAQFDAVPEGVKRLVIFADNDANYVGQEAAYRLARRLVSKGLLVDVAVAPEVGSDWLDAYVKKQKEEPTG